MAAASTELDQMPVVRDLADFDRSSGNAARAAGVQPPAGDGRRLRARHAWCSGYFAATRLALNASFEKMIPQSQPYIQNYLDDQKDLRGLGNALRVVVENTDGDIFDPRLPRGR